MIKVLIVDDEYIMRQGLKYMIDWEQEGFTICGEATNGNEALRMIEELQPHIVISDIVMPVLDGVDFSELVHKMYPQIQIIILSGYDKFDYVKRTLLNGVVDYILKPTLTRQELINVLHNAMDRLPGYLINDSNKTVSHEHLLERYLLGLDKELDYSLFLDVFNTSQYRVYSVNIKKEGRNGKDISSALYKTIERSLQDECRVKYQLLMLREELVFVLFCYEGIDHKKLLTFLHDLNNRLLLMCDDIFGVVSNAFYDYHDLYEVYSNQIIKNVDKAFYYESVHLLELDCTPQVKETLTSAKFDFFKYNQLLGAKQFSEACSLLNSYNARQLEVYADVNGLKNQIKNMIFHFMDFLQMDDEDRENKRYSYFSGISRAGTVSEYVRHIEFVMSDLMKISGHSMPVADERIEKILDYITENYAEDMKLEDLAEEFNFNYHYLSAYFSQQMKEGFSDYLNRLRIDKACELLGSKRYSISEVSGMVGYSEHSYFCRVFKKITGKTPSVYRRNLMYEEKA